LAGRVRELGIRRAGLGQAQVLGDGAVEDVRILRAAADQAAHVVGVVTAQVVTAHGGDAAGQLTEPQEHCGRRRLAGAVRPDQGHSPAGRQVKVQAIERQRSVWPVADACAAQCHRDGRCWPRLGFGRVCYRVRSIENSAQPGRRGPRVSQLHGSGRKPADGLE